MSGKLTERTYKSLGAIFLFFILFTVFVKYSNASVVSAGNITTYTSTTVMVPVTIDNAKDIAGFQFSISYNENVVKFIGVSTGSLTERWSIMTNSQTAGQLKIGGFSPSLTPIGNQGGTLLIIKFLTLSTGSSSLTFNSAEFSDKNGSSIAISTSNGLITVKSPSPPPSPSTYPPTITSFTSSPKTGEVPLTVSFTCNASDSDGVIESYSWDFNGDGTIDKTTSDNSVEYTYTKEGVYRAKVIVRDNDGQMTSSVITINVLALEGKISVSPATLQFGYVKLGKTKKLRVSIENIGSADVNITGISISGENKKDFELLGESNCTIIKPKGKCLFNIIFHPTAEGEKKGIIEISSDAKNSHVYINASGVSAKNKPPTISSFTSSPATGAVPLTVRFTCNASDSDGVIESYNWDFNGDNIIDRTTSTNSVEYTYTKEGVYKAKVVVRDNDNMSDQRTLRLVFFPENGSMTITKDNDTHNDIVFITDNGKIENASVVTATGDEQPPDINTTPKKIISIAVDNVSTDSISITAGPFEIDNDTMFYKKVTKDGVTKWINLTDNAEKYNFKINKTTGMVTLTIQDNGELDANDELGKIYDPIVIVKSTNQEQSNHNTPVTNNSTHQNSNSSSGSGGGGGGCTIDKNAGFNITFPFLVILIIVVYPFIKRKGL